MIMMQCCNLPAALPLSQSRTSASSSHLRKRHGVVFSAPLIRMRRLNASASKFTCLSLSVKLDDVAGIAQNKVLIAAGVSAAIGQLSKPFTSTLIYGKNFDFKAAMQSGGLPSSHSSVVVATATSLGLERGFSDSIFALSVVYAVLVMYDSQGVRREVGIHGKVLNNLLSKSNACSIPPRDKDDLVDFQTGGASSNLEGFDDAGSFSSKPGNSSLLSTAEKRSRIQTPPSIGVDVGELRNAGSFPLKESVGHTEIEAIAGALLGFSVCLAVYGIL